jgi:eukaryotic-like serine/threonine-protein kinase
MNAERLKQIEEIYHAAREIAPAGREAFLRKNCSGDAELRREVNSLLAFEKKSDSLFDSPIDAFAAEIFSERENRAALTGRKISHYQIEKLLGAGGMGEVYLAEDTKLRRKAALKFLSAEVCDNKNLLRRFEREAFAASVLNHPNILTIYEFEAKGEVCWLAAEFVEGKTLREYLQGGRMSLESALDAAIQIASALRSAHSAGIVHRDIKPENIMLRTDGIVKVLDFGLAKLTERSGVAASDSEAATRVRTMPGMILGTPQYMSPEQARGKVVDSQTDIFSFGAVFYEMLSGNAPFAGETTSDILAAVLTKEPPKLNEIPEPVAEIAARALQKDKRNRYQTAKDLLDNLNYAKQSLSPRRESERSGFANEGENKTRILPAMTARENRQTTTAQIVTGSFQKSYTAIGLMILLISAIGFFAYRYYQSQLPINSIAVLPFQNKSPDADSEYLSDGLAESLIHRFSQLPNLRVSPTSSVFRYKGAETDAVKIGGELGVQAVMTGRIAQRGDTLTISVELVDVRNNKLLWGEKYERKLSELLETQREITAEITDKLHLELSGEGEQKLAKKYTESDEAYRLYLKGRFHWNKRTAQDFEKSIEFYEQAVALDANFALAYAGLADTYLLMSGYAADSPHESFPKAKAAGRRALEIDETLAEARNALAYALFNYDWNFSEAEREIKLALKLNPNYATARQWYGNAILLGAGRFDEAIAELKKAQALEPLSLIVSADLGTTLLFARRVDEAIEQFQKTIEMDDRFAYARVNLGRAYLMKNDFPAAIAECEKALALSDDPRPLVILARIYAKLGQREKARQQLDQLEKIAKQKYVSAYYFALVYVGLNEPDRAFEQLEKAFQDREGRMTLLRVDPLMDEIRADSRFADLLNRVGF